MIITKFRSLMAMGVTISVNITNQSEFAASVNEFLTFRRYALLPDKGKVTREEADKKAEEEYRLFDPTQCIDSDFDKEIRGLFDVK